MATFRPAVPVRALGRSPLTNVRVNNPAEDSHQIDQTTQSEPMLTVSGSNVAVGFNDSQTALLALTAGADLTGYAYSTDGGASFTDGGALPNAPGFVNFGDPWLAHDRAGNLYFSNLAHGRHHRRPRSRGGQVERRRKDVVATHDDPQARPECLLSGRQRCR